MLLNDWKNKIEKAALDILWSHWIKLGAYAHGQECQASIDPEALIVLTSIMGPKDLRLVEVMRQWLRYYEGVINVERLKTALKFILKDQQDPSFFEVLSQTIRESIPEKSLRRWSKLLLILKHELYSAASARLIASQESSRKKLQNHQWILEKNELLGFRYILGVTAKADILYFLRICSAQSSVTSLRSTTGAQISRELHYDPATVLRALDDLKEAGLILSEESYSEKVYFINAHSPHFAWRPKTEYFFLDWFTLFTVFSDVEAMENWSSDLHESILLDYLNVRLETLDKVLKRFPRPQTVRYAKENFVGTDLKEMWSLYEQALDEIREAIGGPAQSRVSAKSRSSRRPVS